jgi:hypothetical protein
MVVPPPVPPSPPEYLVVPTELDACPPVRKAGAADLASAPSVVLLGAEDPDLLNQASELPVKLMPEEVK